MAAFYGVQPSPVDDTIWGQSMDVGFSRIDQPGYIIHLIPGADPTQTALAELFLPPRRAATVRAASISTTDGVVWTVLSSGHLASFDRRSARRPLNGPDAGDRQAVPRRLDALSSSPDRSSRA